MIKLFVPGRLCLFGEHTDWAGHYRTMNADIKPEKNKKQLQERLMTYGRTSHAEWTKGS